MQGESHTRVFERREQARAESETIRRYYASLLNMMIADSPAMAADKMTLVILCTAEANFDVNSLLCLTVHHGMLHQ